MVTRLLKFIRWMLVICGVGVSFFLALKIPAAHRDVERQAEVIFAQ